MTLPLKLGLRENLCQFSILVLVNAFVGAMIGLERSILPQLAEQKFHLVAKTAILSFILVFGISKALTNYFAGLFSDRFNRKFVLLAGWFAAIPVPILLVSARDWNWVLLANVFLGISQGLTWSTTVIMKIDLVGAHRRGLAMGLNEFAGYFAVALSALATGFIASNWELTPAPFYLGFIYVAAGLLLSFFVVKETKAHMLFEAAHHNNEPDQVSQKELFIKSSFTDKNLSSITQAGFFNNLNDGMVWGLFPLLFSLYGLNIAKIGWLAAIYPATWGILQIFTGHLSDVLGRKWLISWGMWIQAIGIFTTAISITEFGFAFGAILLGVGTAMVYPTLLAAISDVAHPSWRASAIGIYRLWRDGGYAAGALVAGLTADAIGIHEAIWLVGLFTLLSGVVVAVRMNNNRSLAH